MRGLGYARSDEEALELVLSAAYDAAFFLRATPVSQVQEIAAAGVNMPPKTTYLLPQGSHRAACSIRCYNSGRQFCPNISRSRPQP